MADNKNKNQDQGQRKNQRQGNQGTIDENVGRQQQGNRGQRQGMDKDSTNIEQDDRRQAGKDMDLDRDLEEDREEEITQRSPRVGEQGQPGQARQPQSDRGQSQAQGRQQPSDRGQGQRGPDRDKNRQ